MEPSTNTPALLGLDLPDGHVLGMRDSADWAAGCFRSSGLQQRLNFKMKMFDHDGNLVGIPAGTNPTEKQDLQRE
jgi:hypothetical protein